MVFFSFDICDCMDDVRVSCSLKLQGAIGKFGKHDLSDVEAFAILPDGKVLSGTVGSR